MRFSFPLLLIGLAIRRQTVCSRSQHNEAVGDVLGDSLDVLLVLLEIKLKLLQFTRIANRRNPPAILTSARWAGALLVALAVIAMGAWQTIERTDCPNNSGWCDQRQV
jgi:hypothetical protein